VSAPPLDGVLQLIVDSISPHLDGSTIMIAKADDVYITDFSVPYAIFIDYNMLERYRLGDSRKSAAVNTTHNQ
jgi:hypothetical protein